MGGITSSPLFEAVVALVTVWLVAATITSGIVELLASLLAFRGKHLWRSLDLLLGPESATRSIEGAGRKAVTLAQAPPVPAPTTAGEARASAPVAPTTMVHLIDSIPGAVADRKVLERIKSVNAEVVVDAILAAREEGAPDFGGTTVGCLIRRLPARITDDADTLRARVEDWVDDAMNQMSAAYRSRLRAWTALIGLGVVAVLGIDSGWLASRYYADANARAAVLAVASSATEAAGDDQDQVVSCLTDAATGTAASGDAAAGEASRTCRNELVGELDELRAGRYRLGDGWAGGGKPDGARAWLFMLLGLALSVGAVAMGAPFWFDVLKRLMGLRRRRSGSS